MPPPSDSEFEALRQPFPFGQRVLRNRIVMAPMTRNASPGGIPGDAVARYYARRAAGGTGLLITEGTYIDHPAANGYRNVPAFYGPALDGWRRVVDQVHAEGALIVPQLWHVGGARRRGMEPVPEVPGMGPVSVFENGELVIQGMSQADIDLVVAAYAKAAVAAKEAGFDGVEIHAAHGYLIDQFLWAGSNPRTDGYGGSLANRTRFAAEVVAAMRQAVGADFPVIFRFSQWKVSDYAARIAADADELGRILNPLAAAGVDIFHASTRRFWEPAFDGSTETLAACTRRVTGKPVIAVGSVGLTRQFELRVRNRSNELAESSSDLAPLLAGLARGEFDLVAVGRAMLADAEWASKVLSGRAAEVTPLTDAALKELQ
ncbi:MAG: 12-oxophytodienoate reductase [Burkholderiales bacterium]